MSITYRPPNSDYEFEKYFTFRWEQLRKPLGLEKGSEQDHLEQSAFHIAAFENNKVIGVGRIQLEYDLTARIRYMAIHERFRNQGIGSKLLNELEQIATRNNICMCWLYARQDAVPFYLHNSYEIKGNASSELAIPHKRMQKTLIP